VCGKIRLGFLGVAHFHADSYARAARSLPNVDLIGVYEVDKVVGSRFASIHGINIFSNMDELLREVDAVIITAENSLHHEYAIRAVECGVNVLCEKPMTISLSDADDVVRAVNRSRVKFQMCYVMRYHTVTRVAKSLLEAGRIGRVLAMVGSNRVRRDLPVMRDWFVDRERAGGGAIMDHTVHLADLMRWYTNSEVEEVYTISGRNINQHISVEDNFSTTLQFENGILGHIDGSWAYSSGYYTWGDVAVEIVGSEGVLMIDAFRQSVYFIGDAGPDKRLVWHYYGCDADLEMVKSFVKCLVKDERPLADVYDGRQGVAVTLASYESIMLGRPVRPG